MHQQLSTREILPVVFKIVDSSIQSMESTNECKQKAPHRSDSYFAYCLMMSVSTHNSEKYICLTLYSEQMPE